MEKAEYGAYFARESVKLSAQYLLIQTSPTVALKGRNETLRHGGQWLNYQMLTLQ